MTTYNELFAAILAMDSYNRGYGPKVEDLSDEVGTQIGNASIVLTSEVLGASAESESFYAVAYSYNGETVISYRGTDNPTLTGDLDDWLGGLGFLTGQAKMAAQFYDAVIGGAILVLIITMLHSRGIPLVGDWLV